MLRNALALVACVATATCLSSPVQVLLRCSAASALTGSTHLEIAQGLLERSDVLDAVIECEFSDNAPVMVPLCWSTAEWTASELDELQWPPLIATARKRSSDMRHLAEEHAQPEYKVFGRFKGTQALLTALELAHCHTMTIADGELCLVPARAAYPRSAPTGASLEVCADSGDLIFVGSMVDTSPARAPRAPPNPLLNLFFLGDDEDDETAPGFSVSSGSKTNDELLLTEGWADENLSSDAFELPDEVLAAASAQVINEDAAGDGIEPWKRQCAQIIDGLREAGRLPAAGYGSVLARGGASEALMTSARALSLGTHGVDALGGVRGCIERISNARDEGAGTGFPSEFESRAWRLLGLASEDLLGGFPTSADEDSVLLEELLAKDIGQLAEHRRVQCVRSRLSRKRCLADLLDAARCAVGVAGPFS